MNLLFFAGGSYFAGLESALLGLMATLQAKGHTIEAIVSPWNDGVYQHKLSTAGIGFHQLKLGRLSKAKPLWTVGTIVNMPSAAIKFRRVIRDMACDAVIHVDIVQALTSMPYVPFNVANVMYVHDVAGTEYTNITGRLAQLRISGFICVSHFVANSVRQKTHKESYICPVHNGVSLSRGWPSRSRVSTGRVKVAIVGQIIPRKKHHVLVDAISRLTSADRGRIEISIVGNDDNEQSRYLKKYIRELGLCSSFTWRGFVGEIEEIYGNSDIVVAPAVNEPFGMTILEAGAFALPVIASNSGGFPEIVIDGVTGFLFPPDDASALAKYLGLLVSDANLRVKMGLAGNQLIDSRFNVSQMAASFVDAMSVILLRHKQGIRWGLSGKGGIC